MGAAAGSRPGSGVARTSSAKSRQVRLYQKTIRDARVLAVAGILAFALFSGPFSVCFYFCISFLKKFCSFFYDQGEGCPQGEPRTREIVMCYSGMPDWL